MSKNKAVCPECNKIVAVNDAQSIHCDFFRKHKNQKGENCKNSGSEVFPENYYTEKIMSNQLETEGKLSHYKTYPDPDIDEYDVCIQHPTSEGCTLCGDRIDNAPDGNPEETNEKVNCEYCLETIKVIKEWKDEN